MKPYPFLFLLLAGCAGGPAHEFYNPAVVGAKYPPPVTMTLTEKPRQDADRLVAQGYQMIGTAAWTGPYVEAKELQAQAKRVGANHIVYGAKYVPPQPGSWSFGFNQWGGGGGSSGGMTDMLVIFLGK